VSDCGEGQNGSKERVFSHEEKALLTFSVRHLLLLLAPMAPHTSEELWQAAGFGGQDKKSIHVTAWPKFDDALTIDNEIELVLQVNGKIISKVAAARGLGKSEAEAMALSDGKIKSKIDGFAVRKVIVVQDKLVNVVI